ncbi:hypothetical protein Poli38472_008588 [Pythium oligandrum]|uniref:3-dehydrosphinganine reductase n=1 Tax=Pythium oligandrum TaxID=41045 RepID=A0A8K1C3W5_PYTOL|nr:hypothetical protein Poli38472_008588 [Pythium oligandrum]|eukprot:TMW55940.1 hypothetical protein Poli38472_008588 [Pythium oligandrum]
MAHGWIAAVVLVGLWVLSALWTLVTAPGFKAKDRHVLITGATKGVGLALAKRYAKEGAKLTLVGRSKLRLEAAQRLIQEHAGKDVAIFLGEGDVTVPAEMQRIVEEANTFHDRVTDHIVCAAATTARGWFVDSDPAVMRRITEVNYYGVLNTLKSALPVMVEKKVRGRIVLFSSITGLAPTIDSALICGAQTAVYGLAESLRNEMILYGISVSLACPGSYSSKYPKTVISKSSAPTTPAVGDDGALATEYATFSDATQDHNADHLARVVVNGMRAGYFIITDSVSGYLVRMVSSGVAPRVNTGLEVMLLPIIAAFIQVFFRLLPSQPPAHVKQYAEQAFVWTKLTGPGFKVEGKHVFVTGGSSGLGLAIALKCAKLGAKISIVARSNEKLEAAKKEIEAVSKHPVFIQSTDVTSEESVQKAIDAANKFQGQPTDKVMCCAGLASPGMFLEQEVSVFRKMMDLNYFGVVHTVRAALPAMIKAKNQGQIVIVASACSLLGFIGYTQYASSKYALRGLAESLRNELILYDIGVSIYYPGNIDSPGFEEENRYKPALTAEIEGSASLVKPDDVAQSLINGLSNGYFAITNDPIIFILRIISSGVAPRCNTPFEAMLLPVGILIQLGYGFWMDMVVRNARKANEKKEKTN